MSYIKRFSLLRIKEMEVFVALHENNLDESRELCFEIINDQSNCYVRQRQ